MIILENVTLDFPVDRSNRLKRDSKQFSRNKTTGGVIKETASGDFIVRALEDISFRLEPGDRLALLGHNGAGKTSLLRVLAGLYHPTIGRIKTNGRIIPLLNLSLGMDMEASGYDNILIRGLYLGMSRAEIKLKIAEIAHFSDLDEFLHLPMRTYSSGMRARLAFAISTHVDADILLLDEVVATGDARFFEKAREQIETITENSGIMVLASHSNKVLRDLCTKGLLLEHGKAVASGPIEDVIETYKAKNQKQPFENIGEDNQKKFKRAVLSTSVKSKRVLLINDTGGLSNPGCRAVKKAYKLLFNKYISGMTIEDAIPVNYWVEEFRPIAVSSQKTILFAKELFPVSAKNTYDIDLEKWESLRRKLASTDQRLKNALKNSDLVVINGEGSIHHNSVRSLAVLALAKTAVEAGKKVVLLNSTIQQMMPQLLLDVLPKLEFIHVRESASKKFLASLHIDSIEAPDLAFLALEEESISKTRLLDASGHILVTAGVTANKYTLEFIFQSLKKNGLRPVYLTIGDGGETELAKQVCFESDIPIVDAATLGVKEIIGFLRQFPMVISGRHHINIFLMRAKVPFVPLPSNTWKIEETIKMVNYPILPILKHESLMPNVETLLKKGDQTAIAAYDSYISGKSKFEPLLRRLKNCT